MTSVTNGSKWKARMEATMANCEIRPCSGGMVRFGTTGQSNTVYAEKFQLCVSPYQDEKYGKGMRVHNPQQNKNVGNWRCTVCGTGYGIVRP